jgi:hypothetical protein
MTRVGNSFAQLGELPDHIVGTLQSVPARLRPAPHPSARRARCHSSLLFQLHNVKGAAPAPAPRRPIAAWRVREPRPSSLSVSGRSTRELSSTGSIGLRRNVISAPPRPALRAVSSSWNLRQRPRDAFDVGKDVLRIHNSDLPVPSVTVTIVSETECCAHETSLTTNCPLRSGAAVAGSPLSQTVREAAGDTEAVRDGFQPLDEGLWNLVANDHHTTLG